MDGWGIRVGLGENTPWSVDSHVRGRVRPLPPAYMFIFLLGVRQVGVHLLLIFQSSRLRCNPQTNTQR